MASNIPNGMPRNRASHAQRVTELSECFPLLPGWIQAHEPQAVVHCAIHGGLALIGPKRTRFAVEASGLGGATP
jgi:hypothetical protein